MSINFSLSYFFKETQVSLTCDQLCCASDSAPNQPSDTNILQNTGIEYISGNKKKKRCIKPQWFRSFSWLTLCESQNKLFCYICRKEDRRSTIIFSKNAEKAFTQDGFNNWKKAIEKFKGHEHSLCHREASIKYKASQNQQPVSQQLSNQLKAEQETRRMCLLKQLESLTFLLRQGLAVRGHKDDEGNLRQLLKLRLKDVPALEHWISEKNYFSPDILNEQISIVAKSILRKLIEDIRNVQWFSVIADETSDVANQEQFNISIRWVGEDFVVYEDPIGMIAVPDTTGETLFNVIKDVLIRLNLPIRNCRGQAYDGASNMQGSIKGVATRIQEEEPSAIHVHCLAHCLNLCLQDVARQCKPVRDALDLVNEILKLIKASPKRSQLFNNIKLGKSPETPQLRKLCPTRWTMRTASIDSILKNYTALIDTLEDVNAGSDEHARRAGGLLALMEKFSTFFGLKLSHLLFAASEQLSLTLQSKDISAQDAFKAASLTKAYYQRKRNDENFDEFYSYVLQEAGKIEHVEEPKLPRRKKVPRRIDDGAENHVYLTPKAHFKHNFFEVIDWIIAEISNRFNQPSFTFIQKVETLFIDAANGKEAQIPTDVRQCYDNDLDFDRLHQQLQSLPDLCSHCRKVTNIDTITQALVESDNRAIRSMFSEVRKLLQLYLTVPITSSTSERSFSALRQIKTYLRNTMGQARMNHAVICYVHSDRTDAVDLFEAAKEFACANDNRMKFFGTFLR